MRSEQDEGVGGCLHSSMSLGLVVVGMRRWSEVIVRTRSRGDIAFSQGVFLGGVPSSAEVRDGSIEVLSRRWKAPDWREGEGFQLRLVHV